MWMVFAALIQQLKVGHGLARRGDVVNPGRLVVGLGLLRDIDLIDHARSVGDAQSCVQMVAGVEFGGHARLG